MTVLFILIDPVHLTKGVFRLANQAEFDEKEPDFSLVSLQIR
jgi:hypothetical protein